MGKRGRETVVVCDGCGRQVRRDKAVFFEKVIFSNPLQRHEVYSETYTPRLTREVAYCPGCGKHLRIYEKKQRLQEMQRERAAAHGHRPFHGGQHHGYRPAYGQPPARAPAQPQQSQPAQPSPAPAQPAKSEGKQNG